MTSFAQDPAIARTTGYNPDGRGEADSSAQQRAISAPSPPQAAPQTAAVAAGHEDHAAHRPFKVNWRYVIYTGTILLVCSTIWAVWAYKIRGNPDAEEENKPKEPFWEVYQMSMIVKLLVMVLGSMRLLNTGKELVASHLSRHDPSFDSLDVQEQTAEWASLIGAVLAPAWVSLAMLPTLGALRCRDELNPNLYLPVKTSDDIRHLLELWWKHFSVHGNFIAGLRASDSVKQASVFSLRNVAVLALSLSGWSLLETFKGPCWVNTLVFWAWTPPLIAVLSWFMVDKRQALLVQRQLWSWAELLLFATTCYLLWNSPLDVYCDDSRCW